MAKSEPATCGEGGGWSSHPPPPPDKPQPPHSHTPSTSILAPPRAPPHSLVLPALAAKPALLVAGGLLVEAVGVEPLSFAEWAVAHHHDSE